ncbi:MAG TPA: hypothetical protein VFE24_00330 [Pirellulales bacterium]|nr:hypothetical protein [Pirellulales bacterium]
MVLRWLHIGAVIAAAGGAVFARFVLMPAVSSLAADQRQALHERIRSRWSKILSGAILILLVTGLINFFLTRQLFLDDQQKLPPLYNILFGIKFILAFIVFFLASALAGRSAVFDKLRSRAKFWAGVNVLLLLVIVCISGVLRSTHVHPPAALPLAPVTPAVAAVR